MKKRIATLIVLSLVLSAILLPTLTACNNGTKGESGGDKLVIYNWEDYIDAEIDEETGKTLLDEFADYYKEKTGRALSITYTTFDTNETMMTKVLKGDANVDLICPSEYAIEKLLTAGCLLNHNDIKADIQGDLTKYGISLDNMSSLKSGWGNIDHGVMDKINEMFGDIKTQDGTLHNMTEYMVPYMYGTLGILYNTSVVSLEELEQYGWGVLWNVQKNEKLENKILMKDSVRDTYAAAIFYMYEYGLLPEKYKDYTVQELINCTDDEMVAAAEKVLTDQREHISGYEVDFGKDDMINKIAYVDLAWSGDAMYAIEESYNPDKTFKNLATGEETNYLLDYFVPTIEIDGEEKEFGNVWFDGWAIPKTAQNVPAAKEFINFMCRPDVAMRNMMEIGYTCSFDPDKYIAGEDEFTIEAVNCLLENEYVWEISDDEIAENYPDGDCIIKEIDGVKYDLTEFFGDHRRYPDFNKSEGTLGVMQDFGAQNDAVVSMWERVKGGDEFPWKLIVAIVACVAIVAGAFGLCFLVRHVKSKRQPHIDADSEQQTA